MSAPLPISMPDLVVPSPPSSPISRSSSHTGATLLTPGLDDTFPLSLRPTRIGFARSTSGISSTSTTSSASIEGRTQSATDPGLIPPSSKPDLSSSSRSAAVGMGISSPDYFPPESNVHFSLQGYTIGRRRVSETDASISIPPVDVSTDLASSSPTTSTPSPSAGPSSGFSFGTCPKSPIKSTPTAELGPFEYPSTSTSSDSTITPPLAPHPTQVGITLGRRGSIALGQISRLARTAPPFDPRAPAPTPSSSHPNPPASRRSSTCSTITTLPMSGRRPSILHSATTPALPAVDLPPSPSSPAPAVMSPRPQSPRAAPIRQGSIAFAHSPLPPVIPPSLLARRGSLPMAGALAERRSSALASSSNPAPGAVHRPSLPTYYAGYTTTTAALYHRRDSQPEDEVYPSTSTAFHPDHAHPFTSVPIPPPPTFTSRARFPSTTSTRTASTRSSIMSRGSIMSSRSSVAHSDWSRDGPHGHAYRKSVHGVHSGLIPTGHFLRGESEEQGDDDEAQLGGDEADADAETFADLDEPRPLDTPSTIASVRTPITPAASVGFTDPWSASTKALATPSHEEWAGFSFGSGGASGLVDVGVSATTLASYGLRPHRPSLETIPSDGTDSTLRGSVDLDASSLAVVSEHTGA